MKKPTIHQRSLLLFSLFSIFAFQHFRTAQAANWDTFPAAGDLVGTETIPLNQSGTTRYATINQIRAGRQPLDARLTSLASGTATSGFVYYNSGTVQWISGTSGVIVFTGTGPTLQTLSVSDLSDGASVVTLDGTQTLTNKTISGTANTITDIGNSSLVNSTIALSLGTSGTDAGVSGSPASLGGTLTLNLPTASAANRGLLSPGDWSRFDSALPATSGTATNLTLTGTTQITTSGTTLAVSSSGTGTAVLVDGTMATQEQTAGIVDGAGLAEVESSASSTRAWPVSLDGGAFGETVVTVGEPVGAVADAVGVQAWDAHLDSLSALTGSNSVLGLTGSGAVGTLTLDSPLSVTSGTLTIANSGTGNTGVVQIATDAEIQTGTDTAKVVRVSGLAAFWSWVKTQAQTIAGNWTFSGTTTANVISGTTATVTTGTVGTLNVTGSATMTGNVAIGDAPGDTLVISGSSITAPNATSTASGNNIINLGEQDARFSRGFTRVKTANTARTSTTTLADDPDLVIPSVPVGLYLVRVKMQTYDNLTGGFKWEIGGSATLSSVGRAIYTGVLFASGTLGVGSNSNGILAGEDLAPWSASTRQQIAEGVLSVSVAGSVAFRWAQNTSSATNTTVNAGCYITLQRLN